MARLGLFYRRLATQGAGNFFEKTLLAGLSCFGAVYGGLMTLRAWSYRQGWRRVYRAPVPVISIGNLSVGGTGKTPLVDYLARYYLRQGWRVAVVSRGYGSRGKGVRVVSAGSGPMLDVSLCGDEPMLLARRNPGLLVLVAQRRAHALRHAVEALKAEIVLLDDGFQHLAVARDCDIVLLDARRPFGNGRVLPAGLLRERPSALQRGQVFVLSRADRDTPLLPLPGPVLRCRHRLAGEAVSLSGHRVSLSELKTKRGVAFAGIADPEAFFAGLVAAGLQLSATLAFSDHAAYNEAERQRLYASAARAEYVLTTEKDAVKLAGLSLPWPCYQVGLELDWLEPGALENLLDAFVPGKEEKMPQIEEMLDILACPSCHGSLHFDRDKNGLACRHCRLLFPITDGIPVLLLDEAQSLDIPQSSGDSNQN
jgi:tetraacyldisaccharide 4'-kinase